MKKIIVINVHSFVDVITNSSTELFVCNTGKTIQVVKEILMKVVSDYQQREIDCFDEITGMFKEPYIYTEEMYNNRYMDDPWEYEGEGNIGKIIIEGDTDNSIPYEMWPFIEAAFNTTSEHLG